MEIALSDRRIAVHEAGTMAEAAMKLNASLRQRMKLHASIWKMSGIWRRKAVMSYE